MIYNNQPDQVEGHDILPMSSSNVNPPVNNNSSSSNISSNSKNPLVNLVSSNTIGMQKTGLPIKLMILALLMVLGSLISVRKK